MRSAAAAMSFLAGIAPHDRRAALRRNHRVDAVLLHQHAVGDGDRQRASASAFAGDGGDERHFQPRHLAQVVGDGFSLSALLGAQAGIRADDVDQRDHRTVPLLGELHEAQRLAVALRIGLAEVAIDALLGVAALLRAEHGNFPSLETRHAADHGGVVAKAAVAVDFAEVGKDALDVVQRIRAAWDDAPVSVRSQGVNWPEIWRRSASTRCCRPSSCFRAS